MRLLFYIFLISQIFYFIGVLAEKENDDSTGLNPIKWERLEENKSKSLKKIIWSPYKNEYIYFENNKNKGSEKSKINSPEEERINQSSKKSAPSPINEIDNMFSNDGITVSNALIPRDGTSQINLNYDGDQNLFGSYSYSLSNIFQLNLINIGSFKIKNNDIRKSSQLTNIFLGPNNLNYSVGGKLIIFSPEKNDLFSLSSKVSLGKDLESTRSYIYTDLTSTIKLNNWININISPKYIFSGVGNLGSIGLSNNMYLSNKIQFIAETNIGTTGNSSDNSTFSLRYSYSPSNSIDFFTTNSVGSQDIGSMLSINNYKVGIRMNYRF